MRRSRQQISEDQAWKILEKGTWGVLALNGADGYPYALPINYALDERTLWFHCACSGHKLEAIRNCSKASFCVVTKDQVVPEEYTTWFESVIVFGTIAQAESDDEKMKGIQVLAQKFNPADEADHQKMLIRKEWDRLCVLKLDIEQISGKQAIELVRQNEPSVH